MAVNGNTLTSSNELGTTTASNTTADDGYED